MPAIPAYVAWATLGMVCYSLTTLFLKLAVRDGRFSSFLVLSIATMIVCSTAFVIAWARGDWRAVRLADLASPSALWAYATGAVLIAAVASLFRALSLGPASIVAPIYGMFIVGGSILGMVFLGEPANLRKLVGIALAVVAVALIASSGGR